MIIVKNHQLIADLGLTMFMLLSGVAAERPRDLKVEKVAQLPPKEKRWALLVGIDKYKSGQITPLEGASNDARAMRAALTEAAGFPPDQVVLLTTDQPEPLQPTRPNILQKLSALSRLVPPDGLLIFLFAGHGIDRGDGAFLLPSDTEIGEDPGLLEETAIGVDRIHDFVKRSKVGQVIIFLDACRTDPIRARGLGPNVLTARYAQAFDFDVRNREVIAFATLYAARVGQRAFEDVQKKEGFFTAAVVDGIRGAAANDKGEVTLASLVEYVQSSVTKRTRLALGMASQQPFMEVNGYRANDLVISAPDRLNLPVAAPARESKERPQSSSSANKNASEQTESPLPGTIRRNSRDGLDYIWIPPGEFRMGCTQGDTECLPNELPAHSARLTQGFWLGATPVTVQAYRVHVTAKAWPMPPEPGYEGRNKTIPDFNPTWRFTDHPIVNVKWIEAQKYCEWAGGRLPSEAEWEWAARGGSSSNIYPWGPTASHEKANFGNDPILGASVHGRDQWSYTSPVRRFPPNAFGLFDMAGNVYEWVNDWFHHYAGSPTTDPAGPETGDRRVTRGGSWSNDHRYLRTSVRYAMAPHNFNHYVGFRCAISGQLP